ncbi:hypothetical protein [Paraburkholderia sp. HP33-1]|uniref:hypothetical protein n=1 Tax=Paraburkholderia sp. HP33-1 TaxID=2883243 RepID=UPI001F3541D3|nr:hypothetical protein [Paraburkholderia sp. HP33-1]
MKTIINPAEGDIKNVLRRNDPFDTGAAQLRADMRACFAATCGAAAAHFIRLR